jgi:hypothetical protein
MGPDGAGVFATGAGVGTGVLSWGLLFSVSIIYSFPFSPEVLEGLGLGGLDV